MSDPTELERLKAEVDELKQKNRKLEKINTALIERVESGRSHSADPYAAFEHSVVLAEQVRERTEALNKALFELKVSHQALRTANEQAELANQRLIDAIESISDAFVLFDSRRQIVLSNSRFADFWSGTGQQISPGTTISYIKRLARECDLIAEELPADRDGNKVFRTSDNTWIQMSERATTDGGLVILYTDITELKAAEQARREQALAQKTKLLQSTVDNLSQGVVLINPDGLLELWNDRFIDLTGLSPDQVRPHVSFSELLFGNDPMLNHLLNAVRQGEILASEQRLLDGRVVEVRTHPLPNGSVVNTYTDITERHLYAETLLQSERWVRVITDHVPALIAYMNQSLCYEFTNKVYDDWYGWPTGQLNGQSIEQVHGSDSMATLQPYIKRAMSGESVTFEVEECNAQGEPRYLLKSYVPNLDESGTAVGFFVMIRDITERRRTAVELKEAYQHLEIRVQERTHELTTLNAQLRLEIHERSQIEARLREAKKEAEQANLSKTKFLAAVSHDLLQPLNAARLFTAALAEQELAGQTHSLVNSVSNSLEDVESLLSTLVDISKLDAGVVQPDVTNFRVGELLENIANEYRQIAASEGLTLEFVPSSAVVCTDSQLLARILRNFLSNAIRYTHSGRVLLGCRRRADALSIEVWDTGIGIPQGKLAEVFLEFRRLSETGDSQDKGLGLGLAIVDKISRVMGHQISVASTEGRGSVFSVEVPFGELPSTPELTARAVPQITEYLRYARVLVIDNDETICEGMETLLGGWGCIVTTVLSFDHLLDEVDLGDGPFDLIVADYHLDNDENGVDVVQKIMERLPKPVPVLMITANYSQSLKQEIREKGFVLMNKPIKPLKLKTALIHILDRQTNATN